MEHAIIAIETAVGHEDTCVKIESQEITEGLNGDGGAFRKRFFISPTRGIHESAAAAGAF